MTDKKKKHGKGWQNLAWKSHKYNERIKVKSGTYLSSFCPHCGQELTKNNMIIFEAVNQSDETGMIELSPYLNSYEKKTSIGVPVGEELKDLRCPHCHESFVVPGKRCGIGDAHVASFLVSVSETKVPFLICLRAGCPWHEIDPDDEQQMILEDSHEW
jgi:predicted RNA-binding Zn-ribbon protein involved in translation (DUF1610 family)